MLWVVHGSSAVTTTFELNRDLDIAAVDVQNRAGSALGRLPAEVQTTGLSVTKVSTAFVLGAGFYSESGQYDDLAMDDMFDAVVISGEVGLHKPEPEIFRLGAERLGVAPEECVFVDDLRENCAGAEAVGMAAILHRGADTTVPELESLLGVRLS